MSRPLEDQLGRALTELLAAARLLGGEAMEQFSRKMITTGAAGYQEAMGPIRTAEALYRMADQLAVECVETSKP